MINDLERFFKFRTILPLVIAIRFFLDFKSLNYPLLDVLSILASILMWISASNKKRLNRATELANPAWMALIPIFLCSSLFAIVNTDDFLSVFKFQIKCLVLISVIRYARSLSEMELRFWLKYYSNLTVLSAALCFIEFLLKKELLFGREPSGSNVRWSGNFLWANIACISFGVVLVFVLNSNLYSRTEKFIRSIILVAGIVATSSLAGTFGTILALGYIAWKNGVRFLIYGAVAATTIFYSILFRTGVGQRIKNLSIPSSEVVLAGRSEDSFTWRLIQWRRVLGEVSETPIIGHGLGSSADIGLTGGYLPHNDYLRIMIDLGWVGLICLLFATFYFWFALGKSKMPRAISTEIKSYILLIMVSCAAENVLNQTTIYFLVPIFICKGGSYARSINTPRNNLQ